MTTFRTVARGRWALMVLVLCMLPDAAAEAGSVRLAWNHASEPDAVGYIVCRGTEPRSYSDCVDVGAAMQWTFVGLADEQTYYFAVAAYDVDRRLSDFSDEVSAVPRAELGAWIVDESGSRLLPVNAAQFRWEGGSAGSTFRLVVGTQAGVGDIADMELAMSRSVLITGVPAVGGVPVHVRLWTLTDGELFSRDYSFLTKGPEVTTASATVVPSGSITATVRWGPGHAADWVGLYALGADRSARLGWAYLNGLTSAPATGVSDATIVLPAPLILGAYECRLIAGGSGEVIATSVPITVAPEAGSTGEAGYMYGGVTWASNGAWYGSAAAGGAGGLGAVLRFDTETGETMSLHDFSGPDGATPHSPLVLAEDGDLYGTTRFGGASDAGIVFRLSTAGSFTVLHEFTGLDGRGPVAGLTRGSDGRLYGVTPYGGAFGHGTVYSIGSDGSVAIRHDFSGVDGGGPLGTLVRASDGSLYGTTVYGGAGAAGTVFRIDAAANFRVVHEFKGLDGAAPEAPLLLASDGAMYGTTTAGGSAGLGTVFRIVESEPLRTIRDFDLLGSDASSTRGGLLEVEPGVFYGTSTSGGATNRGTVFRVDVAGTLRTVRDFLGHDGQNPAAGLCRDPDGVLHGTTVQGGPDGSGVVFRLAPADEFALAGSEGRYGGTTSMIATLARRGVPIANVAVTFTMNARIVGTAVTDAAGAATLTDVPLPTLEVDTYANVNAASYTAQRLVVFSRTASLTVTRATPVLTWQTPGPVVSGTILDATQLNATADVPGTFVYSPPAGTVLTTGQHTLTLTFAPDDVAVYTTVTGAVLIAVESRDKPPACAPAISSTSQSMGPDDGTGTVTVAAGDQCAWTTLSNAAWVVVDTGQAGIGNGTVGFSVTANTSSSPRTGTVTIAGHTFVVNQPGTGCVYVVAPATVSFDAAGGPGFVGVTTAPDCPWEVTGSPSWLSVTNGVGRSGSGILDFIAAPNNGTSRSATLRVATADLDLTQAAGPVTPVVSPARVYGGVTFVGTAVGPQVDVEVNRGTHR